MAAESAFRAPLVQLRGSCICLAELYMLQMKQSDAGPLGRRPIGV